MEGITHLLGKWWMIGWKSEDRKNIGKIWIGWFEPVANTHRFRRNHLKENRGSLHQMTKTLCCEVDQMVSNSWNYIRFTTSSFHNDLRGFQTLSKNSSKQDYNEYWDGGQTCPWWKVTGTPTPSFVCLVWVILATNKRWIAALRLDQEDMLKQPLDAFEALLAISHIKAEHKPWQRLDKEGFW